MGGTLLMYRSSNKLSILYRLIFFGSLYVSFQPVKGKDQIAVDQRLTLVCSGSYQGTLYFKKMRHEQFVGIADDIEQQLRSGFAGRDVA